MQIYNHLSWKIHVEHIIPKLSGAGFAVRRLFHILRIGTIWMICFAHFNFVIKYGIILGGYAAYTDWVFILQKRIVKIKAAIGCRSTCRRLFKKLDILLIPYQYIF
jgi:hypothetical protein